MGEPSGLNNDDLDARIVRSLQSCHDDLSLLREPLEWRDGDELRGTGPYRFLKHETQVVERIDAWTGWRKER